MWMTEYLDTTLI